MSARRLHLSLTSRTLTSPGGPWEKLEEPDLGTSIRWEPLTAPPSPPGDVAPAIQLSVAEIAVLFGTQQQPPLCLASGATSEEIALYISKCTSLSLGDQSITAN